MRQASSGPNPAHAGQSDQVPSQEETLHLPDRIKAIFPDYRSVHQKPDRTHRQESGNPRVTKTSVHKRAFRYEKNRNQQLCADRPNSRCGRTAAAQPVRLYVHDFAEHVGVHGKHRPEQHCRPAQLRRVVQPAAEYEDQQISRLIENFKRRQAL